MSKSKRIKNKIALEKVWI